MATTSSPAPPSAVPRLRLDGQPAVLTGSGRDLILTTEFPSVVLDRLAVFALPESAGWRDRARAAGRLADAVHATGLQLEIQTSRGVAVTLGGPGSRFGGMASGSRHLRTSHRRTLLAIVSRRLFQSAIDLSVSVAGRTRSRSA